MVHNTTRQVIQINSNFSFNLGADVLNLLFLCEFFHIFPCIVNAKI